MNEGPKQYDRALVSGLAWTGGAAAITQVFTWTVTLLVARILTPDDYGIIGMAGTYLILAQLVGEFGLGAALVQARDITRDQVAAAGGLSVLIGLALLLVSAACAGPIAAFFHEPRVRAVIMFLSLSFVVGAFRVVPDALLLRNLEFRRVALIDTVEAVVMAATTLGLALLGFDYWALAVGPVAARAAGAVIVNAYRPHPLRLPFPLRGVEGVARFGFNVLASRVGWYLYSNADFAVVGRMLGSAALGFYTIGWNIATVPLNKISAMYQKAVGPIFAAVHQDPRAVGRYLLRLSELIALVTLPASVGLAIVADDLVLTVLGSKWQAASLPLALLAATSAARSLDPILAQVLIWTGRPAVNTRIMAGAAVVMPVLFVIGARWGAAGVAAAWFVGYPLVVFVPLLRRVLGFLDLRYLDYGRAIAPALVSTIGMATVVLGARFLIAGQPSALRLALLVVLGAVSFISILLIGFRSRMRSALTFARSMLGSRSGSAPG